MEPSATKGNRKGSARSYNLRQKVIISIFALALISASISIRQRPTRSRNIKPQSSLVDIEKSGAFRNGNLPAPSFLDTAIDSCQAANKEQGKYPSAYKQIVATRLWRWSKQKENGKINSIQMINNKLGGYMYATKLGVRTPRVLYCGVAKDLPQNISSFGQKYVVKPLEGWNANGVKVIKDGVNILKNEKFSFDSVLKEYKPDQPTVVEELIESGHPKFENLVPPDYKFFVYEGRPEIMFYVDRNKGQYCADFFDVSSRKWKHLENFTSILGPNCPPDKYDLDASMEADMTDAVRILASSVDKNWIRIDMFDSRNGPTLGEFTPYSTHGKESPLVDCVMSYLFIAHSEHHGGLSDDAVTVKESPIAIDVKNELKIHSSTGQPDPVDFFPPEAKEWEQYDQLEKCKKVMEAQRIQN